jgi:hypothetical protein
MSDVVLRTKIMHELYELRAASADGIGAIEAASLGRRVGAPAARTAIICRDLVRHRHVDADGNMMGFVRISDIGVVYYEEITAMNRCTN